MNKWLEEYRRLAGGEKDASAERETAPEAGGDPATVEPPLVPSRLYWEGSDGRIRTGSLRFQGRTLKPGAPGLYWFGVESDTGEFAWVREDRLRRKAEYERQRAPTARCARCDAPGPLTWRAGWLVCGACIQGGQP